ncbi:P-loop ATPase, Sll1717 family [Sphingomonas sp. TWP1-3-1]|uniref:P-loop ATPase, Sll1717 family n=1 Tax=Sphingomonas sp. TWP1-3-1 TaxID=2804612 RepID=UPI003CF92AC6
MMDFRDIAFGYTSAEAERSNDPGLLVDGYTDFKNASEQAISGSRFLFLGYKGAGKSTIGEHLQLKLGDKFDCFVKPIALSDFPFTPFSKIIRGDAEPEHKYPAAWSWILLIHVLESLASDKGLTHPRMNELHDAQSAFRKMGLSPSGSPATIVRTTAKNSFKLSLPGSLAQYEWSGSDTRPASDIPDFVESLKTLICEAQTNSFHYLIIDGLDDILTSREVQFKSLSALVFEVDRLNKIFRDSSLNVKIILLCRTDMYEKVPGANKNKTRHDYAIELDWYHDTNDPGNSLLVDLARRRATRSLARECDVFKEFFVGQIKGKPIEKFLLDMTRHTPRDFLQLLSSIQQFYDGTRMKDIQVNSGMREYSIKYFLPEIRDELSGYAQPDEISQIVSALARLRKREFSFHELVMASADLAKPLGKERVYELCQLLFECSALGHIESRNSGTTHYTFKFRNRQASFNELDKIMLHRGLWKALNVI